jgi:hypothetical protein
MAAQAFHTTSYWRYFLSPILLKIAGFVQFYSLYFPWPNACFSWFLGCNKLNESGIIVEIRIFSSVF